MRRMEIALPLTPSLQEVQGAPEDFVCFDGLRNLECRTLAAEMDEKFGKKSP
jgi:hypothetical protein